MGNHLFIILLILITVSLNTIAQTFLKLGSGQQILNMYLIAGVTAYGLSTIFYISVLGKFNLSFAYPLVIGLTILATTISGAIMLGEKVSTTQWMGIGLMLSAIFTIAFGKKI